MKRKHIIIILIFLCPLNVLAGEENEHEIIHNLYSSEFDEAKSLPTSIELEIDITRIKLNKKEPREILAIFAHPYFCGSRGCKTVILTKTENNKWVNILPNIITHGNIEIKNDINFGYSSISFDGGVLFKYTGNGYEVSKP